MFVRRADGYAVVASMGGAPANPAWYHNLKARPDVVISVDKKMIPVRASERTGSDRDDVWARFTELGPGWEQYATRTDRTMPIMALHPVGQPAS